MSVEKLVNDTPELQKKYDKVFEKIHSILTGGDKTQKKLTNKEYRSYIGILAEIGDPIGGYAQQGLDNGEDPRNVMFKLCDTYRSHYAKIHNEMDSLMNKVDEKVEAGLAADETEEKKKSGLVGLDGKELSSK